MKKLLCMGFCLLALLLMLICTTASAQEYVTLAQLREQIKAGWNETYSAKGREVVADVEIEWFPEEGDVCPLVKVEPFSIDEKDERLDQWRELPHSQIYALPDRLAIDVLDDSRYHLIRLGSWNGKWLRDEYSYYDGELPDQEVQECDVTFEEFLSMVEEDLLDLTGLALEDIHFDEISVYGPSYKGIKSNGEYKRGDQLTLVGGYSLIAHQLVHGIPVLGTNGAGDKGRLLFSYYLPEYRYMTIWTVANPTDLEEDLPLLSFDGFKAEMEKLIDAGKLRGVGAMRFGYATCLDGKVWKLVPVWMVTCGYTDDPNSDKNVLPYQEDDGTVVWPTGYGEHYFSAQTGELLKTYRLSAGEDALPMPQILTWSDVR